MTRTARQPIDLTHVEKTIAKLSECAGLDEMAAHNFRIYAHSVLSRNQTAYIGASQYGESIQDEDRALVDAGLVTLGKFEPNNHPMALSHYGDFPVVLTARGREMAERTVRYETAIRRRDMDADEFVAWQRAVSTPNR